MNYKPWIDAALHDLETAIYLHQGEFWFQATLCSQQAGEKLGKGILIFNEIKDVHSYGHSNSKINKKIQELGLYFFDEFEEKMAIDMQLVMTNFKWPDVFSEESPHTLFNKTKSDKSIKWAIKYLDIVGSIIPDLIFKERSN